MICLQLKSIQGDLLVAELLTLCLVSTVADLHRVICLQLISLQVDLCVTDLSAD